MLSDETGQTGEGLIVRGAHSLAIEPPGDVAATTARFTTEHLFRPLLSFASSTLSPAAWVVAHRGNLSALGSALPHQRRAGYAAGARAVVSACRLAHNFEATAPPPLSSPASVAIASLFAGRTVASVTEQTLIGTRPLATAPTYSPRRRRPRSR